VIAEGNGLRRFERFNDTDEMGIRAGRSARTGASPLFRFHQIGEQTEVRVAVFGLMPGTDGAVRPFNGRRVDVAVREEAFCSGETREIFGQGRHGVNPPERIELVS
jgi:hypothetical protein